MHNFVIVKCLSFSCYQVHVRVSLCIVCLSGAEVTQYTKEIVYSTAQQKVKLLRAGCPRDDRLHSEAMIQDGRGHPLPCLI